jgi:hypothetical protein
MRISGPRYRSFLFAKVDEPKSFDNSEMRLAISALENLFVRSRVRMTSLNAKWFATANKIFCYGESTVWPSHMSRMERGAWEVAPHW